MKRLHTLLCLATSLPFLTGTLHAQAPRHSNELTWALRTGPRTLDPARADDGAADTIRYLTAGTLLRLNRQSFVLEPRLAESWTTSPDGRTLTFHLRRGLRFSDGAPLTSTDVVWSLQRVLAPATAAPVADEFSDAAHVQVQAADPLTVRVVLPKRLVAIGDAFDEIAIEPANRPSESHVTAGPFTVAEYHQGASLRLVRNPYYWRRDAAGHALPYLDALQLDITANPATSEIRFLRGEYGVLDPVPPDAFSALAAKAPGSVRDVGPSLNTEQLWFNLAPTAPLPGWEKTWFTSQAFRMAVSLAIRRDDLVRVAWNSLASPAGSFISPANTPWHNHAVQPPRTDVPAAMQLLASAGFHRQGATLVDAAGHPVHFSILTNAGNHARERMATLIQQDLAALGMQVEVVTLDFPALIERLMKTGNYEAAILGLSNVQPDPSTMDNIWLSSSANHQWNPGEKTPATPWEAEIDREIAKQSSAPTFAARKHSMDQVQQIVAEQQPFIYLVYPHLLYGVAPQLSGVVLTPLSPGVVSEIETIRWKDR